MKSAYRILVLLSFLLEFSPRIVGSCQRYQGPYIGKAEANTFLHFTRTSSPSPGPSLCCDEGYCEENKDKCHTAAWTKAISLNYCDACPHGKAPVAVFLRACHYNCACIDMYPCSANPCKSVTTKSCFELDGSYSCVCIPGYEGQRCEMETNECASNPCHHGTCNDQINSFSCTCIAGYTGQLCETDINECASSPCQNGATCHDQVNSYRCECADRFYSINCETNICQPTPADVVFLLDSSISMTETQFKKQLDFITTFSDHVVIGKNDFQISVVTFSFDANIEFYLKDYTNNITLKEAVTKIKFRPGATYTDKALNKLSDVFKRENGGERRINNTLPARFLFLMTDGMSTDNKRTVQCAKEARRKYGYGFQIAAIGIGNEVCHQELLDIASDPSLVYSVQDFDSLYTVLKNLVHITCDECWSSSVSDVAIYIDTSNTMTHFHECLGALSYLIDNIDLHVNKTRISVAVFDQNVQSVFGFDEHFDRDDIHTIINTQIGPPDKVKDNTANITEVLNHAESKAFQKARNQSKKLAMVFTNGKFKINNHREMNKFKGILLSKNITTVYIGSGPGADIDTLLELTNDQYDVYVEASSDLTYLKVLKSYMTYNVCELENGGRDD